MARARLVRQEAGLVGARAGLIGVRAGELVGDDSIRRAA